MYKKKNQPTDIIVTNGQESVRAWCPTLVQKRTRARFYRCTLVDSYLFHYNIIHIILACEFYGLIFKLNDLLIIYY